MLRGRQGTQLRVHGGQLPCTRSPGCSASGFLSRRDQRKSARGTREERQRFLAAPAREGKPGRRTFAPTPAHSGARLSEVLAPGPADIDVTATRNRTVERRTERWREVPLPNEVLRALDLVHGLCAIRPRRAGELLWPWSGAPGHRRIAAVMERAGIPGPQAGPEGLRHSFGIAALSAGAPLSTIASVLDRADIFAAAIHRAAAGLEARRFPARMRDASSTAPHPPGHP